MSRTLSLIPLLSLSLVACSAETWTDSHAFDTPVETVLLDAGSGDVELRAVEGLDGARVVEDVRWSVEPPTVQVSLVGTELQIRSECHIRPAIRQVCDVDLRVEVPAPARVYGEVGSGDLVLRDVSGGVDLLVGSGDVGLDGVSGAVRLDLGSGDLLGSDLRSAELEAVAGSGDMDLAWVQAPAQVWAEAGSGDVDLVLPQGSYALTAHSDSGDVSVSGLVVDGSAPAVVDAISRSGDVRVVGW